MSIKDRLKFLRDLAVFVLCCTLLVWFAEYPTPAYAATPTVSEVTESNNASTSTTLTVSLPSPSVGDLLLMYLSCTEPTLGSDCDPVLPGGWTTYEIVNIGTFGEFMVIGKDATGSEGASVAVTAGTASTFSAQVYRVLAANWEGTLATAVDCTAVANVGADSNPDPGAVTAGWGSDTNLFIAYYGAADDDETQSAVPTSYGSGVDTISGAGMDSGNTVGTATRALTAASDNPDTFTISGSESWRAGTCVVQPSAATNDPLRRRR